jgi:hypothetical protein
LLFIFPRIQDNKMFRRALKPCQSVTAAVRKYTDFQHFKYPVDPVWAYGVPLYYAFFFVIWFRMSTVFTKRGEYKNDYLRVWKRKLGTGYAWSDAWGPEIQTFYKNLPSGTA